MLMAENMKNELNAESPELIADMKAVLQNMTGQPMKDDDAIKALQILEGTLGLARLYTAGAIDVDLGDKLLQFHQGQLKKILEKEEEPEVK